MCQPAERAQGEPQPLQQTLHPKRRQEKTYGFLERKRMTMTDVHMGIRNTRQEVNSYRKTHTGHARGSQGKHRQGTSVLLSLQSLGFLLRQ